MEQSYERLCKELSGAMEQAGEVEGRIRGFIGRVQVVSETLENQEQHASSLATFQLVSLK